MVGPALEGRSLASPWRALGIANYRLFFAGQFVVQNGRWLLNVAQAWLVLDLTGSPLVLGSVTAVQFAPILMFSLFAGPLADRFPKRHFLMALQALSASLSACLALLVIGGHVQLWQVYVLAALAGTVNALDNPVRQSFLSELVGQANLQSAVGLHSSVQNGARIVGPAIGGIVIAGWGTGWCFVLTTAAFAFGLAMVRAMRVADLQPAAIAATGPLHKQVAVGLGYVGRTPALFVPLAIVGLLGTIGFNWSVYLPLLARYVFEAGPTGFGLENAAMGIGALGGGLLVASRRSTPAPLQLAWVGVLFSGLLLGLALAPSFAVLLAVLLATGSVSVLVTAGASTLVQLRSRTEYRGRVLSLLFLLMAGGTPIGGALSGSVAATWDVRVAMTVNAALCFTGCVAAILYLRSRPPTDVAET